MAPVLARVAEDLDAMWKEVRSISRRSRACIAGVALALALHVACGNPTEPPPSGGGNRPGGSVKGEPLVVIVRVTRLGRVGGRYLADCDLIAVERGETAFKKGDRFQVRLWPPTRQLRDPGPVPQRMVFEEPLKPLYEGHCEAVARNEDLGVEEGEESDRWATVAVVRVKEIKKYLLGPEDLDVTGADIGQERRSAACELVRVVKGTSEVGPGEDFKIRSCAPEYDFVVDRETDGPVDVVVRIGFEEVLKHRVQGYWCVLSILR